MLFQSEAGGRVDYERPFGSGAKSARLKRPPPLLQPPSRETNEELATHVRDVYDVMCPHSPHQRDDVKRRLSPHLVQEARALIRMNTFDELYSIFQQIPPNAKLSKSKFKRMAPWNLKKAYRETCLCRCCESLKMYVSALNKASEVLQPLLPSSFTETDVEENKTEGYQGRSSRSTEGGSCGETDSGGGAGEDSAPQKLVNLCAGERKSQLVNDLVFCGGGVTSPACIKSECNNCGFHTCASKPGLC